MRAWVLCVICAAVFSFSERPALCQTASASSWGVSGNFAKWTVSPSLKRLFSAQSIDIQGWDLSAGVVRGRVEGGDWGVSIVKKTFTKDSVVDRTYGGNPLGPGPYSPNGMFSATTNGTIYRTTSSSSLLGVEFHKYVPFATIKHRVQIGMNFAGGVAQARGDVVATLVSTNYLVRNGQLTTTQLRSDGRATTKDIFATSLKAIPLGAVEVAGSAILGPRLKLKAMGGFDFPSYQTFAIGVVYFFGS